MATKSSASSRREKRRLMNGGSMKKKLTSAQKNDLKALATLPDSEIDTSDIPEIRSLKGGVRGLFYRPPAEPVVIELSPPDAATARRLSQSKGVPYQTY